MSGYLCNYIAITDTISSDADFDARLPIALVKRGGKLVLYCSLHPLHKSKIVLEADGYNVSAYLLVAAQFVQGSGFLMCF